MPDPALTHAIAIVGMSGRFPGAADISEFWRNIREGVEALQTFTDAELDQARVDPELRVNPSYVRKGTVLQEAEHFDAGFFGYSPREAQILDPQQRIFLECAWEALEHAGYAGACAGQSVGVYAGLSLNSYVHQLLSNRQFVASAGAYQLMLGNEKDFLATRVSYKLDLRGPSMTVQTACSTSLVAVTVACRALQRGECDMALAGGASVIFPQRGGYLYEEGMILSPDGHCRPFDEKGRGIRAGAGAGIVVLKRLADAVADRDTVHAVIRGAAINNDGAGKAGYTAPSVEGQLEVIATAQALAGVDPRSIAYVEAHGTATPLGDPIEIAALTKVFRASTADVGFCRLGSLKANLGHLDAAAGVASLIKTVLVLKNREFPPLVNFQRANPQLALDTSPFVASAVGAIWDAAIDGTPRRAGVSSFGIGGTNAHVVLEEASPGTSSTSAREAQLLVLSARTPAALDRATANLVLHLDAHPEESLADVAWTLQAGRQAFPHRRVLVARDAARAVEALRSSQRPPVLAGTCEGGSRQVAFLFSGQGSQHRGMGAGLYRTERAYREALDLCARLLEPHLGLDLREVLFGSGPAAELDETYLTQPALFATEYALACLWASWGVTPGAMLGHSIGEYLAAHLAGVLSLEDALAVVAARGRLMQAVPPGSMAAVHLAPVELERHLATASGVEIAAINAPGLCTVSGPSEAVLALSRRLAASGVELRPLHTSHAFHSAMMDPVLAPFRALVEGVKLTQPRIPYVSNLTGTWITKEQATSPEYYAQHLRQAVRFEDGLRALAGEPARLLLEVGPGNTLTSLARLTLGREGSARAVASLPHPKERRSDAEGMLETAGRLWLAGVVLEWKGFHADEAPRRVPLPTYPFERKRYWVDALPHTAPELEVVPPHSSDVRDWFYAPTWTRQDAAGGSPRLEGTWLVLAPPGLLGESVVRRVKEAGATAVLVEPGDRFERVETTRFRVRPGAGEDVTAIVEAVRTSGGDVSGAIHLWSAAAAIEGHAAPGPAYTQLALAYHGLVATAASLANPAARRPVRIIAATAGAESVLDERVLRPEAALALGPVLTMPTEIPGTRMRAVDLDLAEGRREIERAASDLVEEAAADDGESVTARRAGRRWARRVEQVSMGPAEADTLPLQQRGVYLITGGTGGIGLTLARWLADRTSARLLLTARTPLPSGEDWDAWLAAHGPDERQCQVIRAIREIEQAGGEVLVVAADAADEGAMTKALDQARARWGKLDGVIHAAGVPGNGRVAFLKPRDEVEAVLSPKLDGLRVLIRLLGDAPLDFVVLLSSVNALMGWTGVCDHAAGNSVLDAFVDSVERPGNWRRVMALDYSAWSEVGMATRAAASKPNKEAWDEVLRRGISSASGAEAFGRALASGRDRVAVVPTDLVRAMELVREQARGATTAADAASPAARELAASAPQAQERPKTSTPYETPATEAERRLASIWTELLGVDAIGVNDDFFELGGHSLMATRVLARVEQSLGARLSLRDVFEAPTIHLLAEKVIESSRPASSSTEVPEPDREELVF